MTVRNVRNDNVGIMQTSHLLDSGFHRNDEGKA